MSKEFKVLMSGSSRLLIRLYGPITEKADFRAVRLVPSQSVEVDLNEVTSINSSGIRGFRDWICSIPNDPLVLSYCPKFFIDQLNMVYGLVPQHTRVLSFHVPYFCESSGEERSILYSIDQEFWREGKEIKFKWPEILDSTGHVMELDMNPLRYFIFLDKYC